MHAFILCGGFATRLWPLSTRHAKALLPIAGKPLLSHTLENLSSGIPVIVSTNITFKAAFEQWMRSLARPVTLLSETATSDDTKLGALGALSATVKQLGIDDDILVLTGDNYFGFSFDAFLKQYRGGTPLIAAYDLHDLSRASSFGNILLNADGVTVEAFEEKPSHPRSTLVSTGCWVIPHMLFPLLHEFAKDHPDNIGELFSEFLRRGVRVECFVTSDPWFDIGSFRSYIDATKAIVRESICLADGAAIDAESHCSGSVVLSEGSTVVRSTLKDVVLLEGCLVEDCVLKNCILDHHCILHGVEFSDKVLMAETRLEGKDV